MNLSFVKLIRRDYCSLSVLYNVTVFGKKFHYGKKSASLAVAVMLTLSAVLGALAATTSFMSLKSASAQSLMSHPTPLITGVVNSGNAPSTSIFKLPAGYKIQPVLWNLTLPSTVTFDDNGSMYIAESGYSYGEFKPIPRILKLDDKGRLSVLVDRGLNGPITDIEFNKHDGLLYASHRGVISVIDGRGHVKDLIVGLPSMGDHHNDQIAFGTDGRLYFGQGTVTNVGVAGEDSYAYGWLKTSPELHDIPGKSITLTGQNFESANPLTPQNFSDFATTGAFVPFGTSTTKGQLIKGDVKCSGCIISSKLDGTDLKVVAWGLRNPYGVAFANNGKTLLFDNNGADERGSRRVANDSDKVYTLDVSKTDKLGEFLGWPDYFGNAKPVTNPEFNSESQPNREPLQFLMQDHPPVQKPISLLGEGVAATQASFSNSSNFGFKGMAFIGEFGTAAPLIHPFAQMTTPLPGFTPTITGQKVVMLDPATGNYSDFISPNRIDRTFHPVGVKFDSQGDSLYVVSYGKVEIRSEAIGGSSGTDGLAFNTGLYPFASIHATVWSYPNTGVVWKITKVSGTTSTSTTPQPLTTKTTASLQAYTSPPIVLQPLKVAPSASSSSNLPANSTTSISPSTAAANQTSTTQANVSRSSNSTPSPTGIPGIP
jgi:glucose/arabinose dehydrogenase